MNDLPCLSLPTERINARAQKIKYHALIGKFMELWPIEHALRGWIAAKWKPVGTPTTPLDFTKNQGGPHVNFCKYLTFYFLSYYCAWLDMIISLLPLD